MHYTKPPLNFKQQAHLLVSRGLEANENELEKFLGQVNYFRFSGYLYPFRLRGSDNFQSGTTFNQVKEIYFFDKELRLFTLSFVETIEIALLRTIMVEKFTLAHGPFCYTDRNNFRETLSDAGHQDMLEKIQQNIDRSNEEFVDLYRNKYISETHFPFWMVSEALTFGQLSIIFHYLPYDVQVPIAKPFNLHSRDLSSWLHTLSTVRNMCAHHSRLWNRILPIKPAIPSRKYQPKFYLPNKIRNDSYFVILAIMKHLLAVIVPENTLIAEFTTLLKRYPNIPLNKMGFPNNWENFGVFQ